MNPFVIVSATTKTPKTFTETLLYKSLSLLPSNMYTLDIAYENRKGLPTVYNEAIERHQAESISGYFFMHDDVLIEDGFALGKIFQGWQQAHILGCAGASKFDGSDPYWMSAGRQHASGCVHHKEETGQRYAHSWGLVPLRCLVMDGLFLACRKDIFDSDLRWDERFTFHHYDIDFTLQANERGFVCCTIPLHVFHGSHGNYECTEWYDSAEVFKLKWGQHEKANGTGYLEGTGKVESGSTPI